MVCAGVERLFDFLARLVPGVHTNTRGECIETGRRSKREAKQGNGEARLSQGKEAGGDGRGTRHARGKRYGWMLLDNGHNSTPMTVESHTSSPRTHTATRSMAGTGLADKANKQESGCKREDPEEARCWRPPPGVGLVPTHVTAAPCVCACMRADGPPSKWATCDVHERRNLPARFPGSRDPRARRSPPPQPA